MIKHLARDQYWNIKSTINSQNTLAVPIKLCVVKCNLDGSFNPLKLSIINQFH